MLQFICDMLSVESTRSGDWCCVWRLSYYRRVNVPQRIVVYLFCRLPAVTVAAQEGESEEPQTYKEKYEQQQKKIKKPIEYPWFVGGAVGFAFCP